MYSSITPKPCSQCGSKFHSKMYHKPKRPLVTRTALPRPKRRIKQKGTKTLRYEQWRDEVAKPYLDATFGHICAACGLGDYGLHILDVDHKQNRGSHPELIMNLNNVQWLGREPCHRLKTDRIAV